MSFRRPGKSGPFCHRGETIAVFWLLIIVILIQEHDFDNKPFIILKVTSESEEDMQCHCSVLHNSAITSTSSRIQLRFVVEGMQPNQVTFCLITITTASTYMQHHNYDMIVMANIIAAITIMIAMIIMIMMIAATAD